jgi:hypothetical protein
MDSNLVLEDELGFVYDELLKTLANDHLDNESVSMYFLLSSAILSIPTNVCN